MKINTILIAFALILMLTPRSSMAQNSVEQSQMSARYAQYNEWANEQMTSWLMQASDSQMHKTIESSFNTLYKTVVHLWNAEVGWMQSVKNESWQSAIHPDSLISSTDLLKGWQTTSSNLAKLVNSLNSVGLQSKRVVGKKDVPLEDILLHVFNHATYHRGQLITMGRQVGLTNPPRLDYIYYITQ